MKTAPEFDSVRLGHMLQFALEARHFADGQTRATFGQDRQLQLSIDKPIQNIGEAANHVTPDVQREYSGIPWSDIIGMRHKLVHRYFLTNLDIVWRTAIEYLPTLVTDLERILADDRA